MIDPFLFRIPIDHAQILHDTEFASAIPSETAAEKLAALLAIISLWPKISFVGE
jgi:hypothetical protein